MNDKKSQLLFAKESESQMEKRTDNKLIERSLLILLALAIFLLFSVPIPVF